MPDATHEGNDPMGAPTLHRGLLENCPAPDCQDRILEQQEDAETERPRGELWSLLDWTFWGSGMGDVFREPLADTMLAAITPEQLETAEKLMEAWHASGRQPLGRRHYENLSAQLKAVQEQLAEHENIRAAVTEGKSIGRPPTASDIRVAHEVTRKQLAGALDAGLHLNWPQLVEEARRSHAANAAWMADVQRVRDLHSPVQHMEQTWCAACSVRRRTGPHADEWLAFIPHPCPTIDALENKEPTT